MSDTPNQVDESLLKNKLKDRKITLVAENTGLSTATLYNWLSGRTEISQKSINKLVNYFLQN